MSESPSATEDPFEPIAPDVDDELRALAASIRMAQGFKLIFARCNFHPHRQRLLASLRDRLGAPEFVEIALEATETNLLQVFRARLEGSAPAAVFVSGLENVIPYSHRPYLTPFIANLNATRDAFPRAVRCPIVLWISGDILAAIARGAPDFFSVRTAIFDFPATRDEMASLDEPMRRAIQDPTVMSGAERTERIHEILKWLEEPSARGDGRDDLHRAHLLVRLGALLRGSGRSAEAGPRLREARRLFSAAGDRRAVAFTDNELALVEQDLGDTVKARRLLKRSIAFERSLGANPGNLATRLANLATVEYGSGNLERAGRLLRRAISIDRSAFGPGHPHLAVCYSNLAAVEQQLGHLIEANRLLRRAIVIDRRTFGPDYSGLANRYSNLANVENARGAPARARRLLKRAIAIGRDAYGRDDPRLAILYSNLAMIERALNHMPEARRLMARSLAIDERVLRPDHPDLIVDYSNMAKIEWDLGNRDAARRLMGQAFGIARNRLGPDHPRTKRIEHSLREYAADRAS